MESIKELRERLQGSKVRPKGWSRPFGYILLQRGPSIYITRMLLGTRVTANQITVFNLFLGFIGAALVFYSMWELKLVGIAILFLHTILDRVDGEIARYRQTFSLKGIYIDEITHLVIPPLFFMALAFGLPPHTILPDVVIYFAGALAAISAIVIRVTNSLSAQIYAKKYLKQPELFNLEKENSSGDPEFTRSNLLHAPIRMFHLTQEFFLILLAFAFVLIYERVFLIDHIFYPTTSWTIVLFSIALSVIAIENLIKGWFRIEGDIRAKIES